MTTNQVKEGMEQTQQKERKFGFFRQYITAVAKPQQYEKYLQLTTGRVVLFMVIFMLISTFIGQFLRIPVSELFGDKSIVNQNRTALKEEMDEYVPDFVLENGELKLLSAPTRINEEERLIIIDDSIRSFEQVEVDGYIDVYKSIILASRTNLVMYSNGAENINTTYDEWLADHERESLNKQELYDYLDKSIPQMVYRMAVFSTVVAFFFNMFYYFLDALFLMIIGKMMMNIWRFGLSYADLFKLSVYSTVSFWTLNALLNLYGIFLPNIFFIAMLVGFVYLWIAVNFLKKSGYEGGMIEKKNLKEYAAAKKTSRSDIYKKAMINTASLSATSKASAARNTGSEGAPFGEASVESTGATASDDQERGTSDSDQ